jgi:hypothetical protein
MMMAIRLLTVIPATTLDQLVSDMSDTFGLKLIRQSEEELGAVKRAVNPAEELGAAVARHGNL